VITKQFRKLLTVGLLVVAMSCFGCGRAPSFDILGSFFPAWLICLASGLLLALVARWLLLRTSVVLALPVLTYSSLTALFTFALWLAFFR
jgi:YtcA family